jgi:predicted DNA-binding protein
MSRPITTSIRLSPRLRRALEVRAQMEGRGKNWIISEALESYLGTGANDDLEAEARRQSLLASATEPLDWSDDADLRDWK